MARKKKKISTGAMLWLFIAALLCVALSVCVLFTVFSTPPQTEQSDAPDSIAGLTVHTDYIPRDSIARPGKLRAVHYIVIHETDNKGPHATAKAHNEYIHENCWKEQKSWHYTVDDTEIWHHLPDNEIGYHAGDHSYQEGGNRNGIGIELCVNQGGDFDHTMRNAAQLTAYLLLKYELSLENVKQHRDFSGKICPQTMIRQNKWNDFLNLVQGAYDAQSIQKAQKEDQAQGE
ncbi:MAG TPA: hypothetical protein DDX51_01800 [Clostridiales bacterium]|nr:hypothetical protein [Clostridiales bacterium]